MRTLLLQMAADKERQEEIGARIKELRQRTPQPVVADAVGVTLRAYQAWEAGDSGIAWDNLVKLAKYFKVSADYIEYGEAGRQGPSTQLDRIEAKLDRLLELLDPDIAGAVAEAIVNELESRGAADPPAAAAPGAGSRRRSDARTGAPAARAPRTRKA